jgi:hypothetical protein
MKYSPLKKSKNHELQMNEGTWNSGGDDLIGKNKCLTKVLLDTCKEAGLLSKYKENYCS